MVLGLIILACLISAVLFDLLPVLNTIRAVLHFQRESVQIIQNKGLTDEQKQKSIFRLSGKILRSTFKLILFVLSAMIPISALVIIGDRISKNSEFADYLISLKGIFLTFITFLLYFLLKKGYAKL